MLRHSRELLVAAQKITTSNQEPNMQNGSKLGHSKYHENSQEKSA
jgi:hypothetical protein